MFLGVLDPTTLESNSKSFILRFIMEIGLVQQINIEDEMRGSYLSYAMSVIVSRALPDVRDGLKPVQRRILYAMYDMGLTPDKPYKKSARVVGEVLGKYHPHGDQSVYETMVRMAQDFSLRYPLVDGQGNFGSIDGDAAAAMRYTEARMSPIGRDLLDDLEKETVAFTPNFDDSLKEPAVLPSNIPNLLINGSSGIAVGMSTNIPPHNLGEVVDGLCFILDHWNQFEGITVKELMQFIKGPDFPTGGLVFRYRDEGETDVLAGAYATGRGKLIVRAKAHVEQMERNKSRIVITELPYQTNKTNLISKIADLHREGKIEGLTDLRDESDRNGMRIIVETTRNVEVKAVLVDLFRQTPMQDTFSVIMVALVNGEPRVLTLKQALRCYLDHRLEVVRRRSQYDLNKAKERAHILEGLLLALDNLDGVIDTIRRSRNADTARDNLQKNFKFSVAQAQAVLEMQLRRLAALERRKIQDEHKEKLLLIKELERLLSRPELMRETIKKELLAVKEKYGDNRRTQIVESSDTAVITPSDLIPDQRVWVMVGEKGTLARTPTSEMVSFLPRPDELPRRLLEANTQDVLYLFTTDGRAVNLPVYQLPQARELGKGTHWADLTSLTRRDHLADVLIRPVESEGYLFLATVGGVVKRLKLEDVPGITGEAFPVFNVPEADALGWVRLTTGTDEMLLITAMGQTIRFKEDDVRPMGLAASGVMGIKLTSDEDGVVMVAMSRPESYLFTITNNGLGKATPLEEYPLQGRYGQGVINLKLPKDARQVVTAAVITPESQLWLNTGRGDLHLLDWDKLAVGSRAMKPQSVINLENNDQVTGITTFNHKGDKITMTGPRQLALLGT